MYQVIPMSQAVEKQLNGVKVLAIRLDLDPKNSNSMYLKNEWVNLHKDWKGKSKLEVSQIEHIAAYQNFYKLIGLNPKKTPPSVQNIIQRFLIKEEIERFPLIHPIVDAVNIAAIKNLIPLGTFDAECVEGEISLTLSIGGEKHRPLGSNSIQELEPDLLVLTDSKKVLSQFCYRDSEEQKITENTRSIWVLGCQVPGISIEDVIKALDESQVLLKQMFNLQHTEG
jgi:DNA/RNA-binding domain of Phe-tRNA-synthetase-like protein